MGTEEKSQTPDDAMPEAVRKAALSVPAAWLPQPAPTPVYTQHPAAAEQLSEPAMASYAAFSNPANAGFIQQFLARETEHHASLFEDAITRGAEQQDRATDRFDAADLLRLIEAMEPEAQALLGVEKAMLAMAARGSKGSKLDIDSIRDRIQAIGDQVAAAAAANRAEDGKVIDFAAMQKDLYANDAVYRAATDANRKETAEALSSLDQKLAAADKRAEERGYKTDLDEPEKKARKAYEEAMASGNDLEAYKKLQEWLEIRKKQNEERIAQARVSGDTESEALYTGDTQTAIGESKKKFGEVFEKQLKTLLDAEEKKLAADGISLDEIKKKRQQIELDCRKKFQNAETSEEKTALASQMEHRITATEPVIPTEERIGDVQTVKEETKQAPSGKVSPAGLPSLEVANVSAAQTANLPAQLPNMALPGLPDSGLPPLR